MKPLPSSARPRLILSSLALALLTLASAPAAPEDLTGVYEAGRAAFNKGDLVTAKAAFTKVLRAKPDFDLAKIYMAQIRHAEAQWQARPRSQKIAETATVAAVDLKSVTLADALEVVRRELERSATGPHQGAIALITDLDQDALDTPLSLSVRDVSMTHFIGAVAFTGGVRIHWHPDGISASGGQSGGPGDAETTAAIQQTRAAAQAQILPHLQFDHLSVADALDRLRLQLPAGQGLILAAKSPLPNSTVTLDLRNIPLSQAINSVALVAGMEVSWHPWGAGLMTKPTVAAAGPGQ